MEPVAADVASGRDPAWREAWEERLDDTSRRLVRDAVKNGTAVQDPDLVPFVTGLVARKRRSLRSSTGLWAASTLATVFWVYATTLRRPSTLFAVFWLAMLIVCVTVIPLRLRSARRTLARCQSAQGITGRDEAKE